MWDRRLPLMALFGFSSGLPFALSGDTLQAWLKTEGMSLTVIGFTGFIGYAYACKFLWAPLVDLLRLPGGVRRGWLFASQIACVLALLWMSFQTPASVLTALAVAAVALAVASATQDVVADAYRIEVLAPEQFGRGVGLFVGGYRLGYIVSGGLALVVAQHLPWSTVFQLLAGCQALGLVATMLAPEPAVPRDPPGFVSAVVDPLRAFIARHGPGRVLLILAFVMCYRMDDSLAGGLLTPFLQDVGYALDDIGYAKGVVGLAATIVGTLVGGVLVDALGLNRALWILGTAQVSGILAFAWLAADPGGLPGLYVAVTVENFASGLGLAALLAFLMQVCEVRFSALQYALLTSFLAFSRSTVRGWSGWCIDAFHLTWTHFFLIATAIGLPGLLLLLWLAPWPRSTAIGDRRTS